MAGSSDSGIDNVSHASSSYQLFENIEKAFQGTQLSDDRWYIMTIATLVGSPEPGLAQQLYLYLINKPQFQSPSARQALIRRLREALVKAVCSVGVVKPLEAVMAINQVEKEADKDHSSTREGWQCDQANADRAMGWMTKLYTKDTNDTMDLFNDHKDFIWITKHISYGLYLSDRQILDDIETQLVVLPTIMIQNMKKESIWHIRGTRRLGVSRQDLEVVWDCVQQIARELGMTLDRVPTVASIEVDV